MSNKPYDLTTASRIYAIGDIHGRLDLLEEVIEKIDQDMERSPCSEAFTVTLGDYIDRGPNSRGVMERLLNNPFPTDYVPLKGNHEELLETFIADPSAPPDSSCLAGERGAFLT